MRTIFNTSGSKSEINSQKPTWTGLRIIPTRTSHGAIRIQVYNEAEVERINKENRLRAFIRKLFR